MSGKLILLFNNEKIDEIALDQEAMVIGRQPNSDIHLDNLAVSGSHARILTIMNDSFVEDLNSTNGTFVNGDRVTRHALQGGDLITVGKHQLRYVQEGDSAEAPEMAMAGGLPDGDQVGNIGAARLRLLSEEGRGKELPLSKALTTVGKPGVQVAAISRRQQGDFIVHVDGGEDDTAVPVVNGSPIGYNSRLLRHQDVIEIAGVRMEYLQDNPQG